MQTPILETVLSKLDGSKGRWREVAKGSGVPFRTLEKIGRRVTKNPGIEHIERLLSYFSESSRENAKRKTG